MKKQITWLEAILKVLESTKTPMHYTKIWDVIRDKHYRECDAKTNPETIVNSTIQLNRDEIVSFGDKGCYVLKKHLDATIKKYFEQNLPVQQGIIRAYGRKWNKVKFKQNNYKMLGKLANGRRPSQVDLSLERGVYVLYNGYEIVYVGQTTNPIAARIKAHIKTNEKWDSFSWYGIDAIENGQICKEKVLTITPNALIDAFEAVMIMATDPRFNKQRGNNVRGQEYQQI